MAQLNDLLVTGSSRFLSDVTANSMKATVDKSVLIGTGTAAQDKGSGVSPRYFPAKWTFDTGMTVADGDIFTIKIPVVGSGYGEFISVNNGTNYYPVGYNTNSLLTTHFPVGAIITVVFKADGQINSIYPVAGGDAKVNVSDGAFYVTNLYDSGNSNTYDRNRFNAAIKVWGTALVAQNIIVANTSGLYMHLKQNAAFDITYPILYLAEAVAANGTTTNTYDIINFPTATTQSGTWTAYKPVFIKGTLSDTTFTPVSATPLTQTIPTSCDGYEYILLGIATATTTVYLQERHPIYAYVGGAFHEIVSSNLKSLGYATVESGTYSHAEGYYTTASNSYAHAEGEHTVAKGQESHSEGSTTTAFSEYTHAEGVHTSAKAPASHTEGYFTTAQNANAHASGHFNAAMTAGGQASNTGGTAFVIGNGTGPSALKNAFSVQFSGVVKAASTITASTTADYAEYFEWADENPNAEDRVGYFVTFDSGDKIKIGSPNDDYILGIVSGEPFVLGNGDCDVWNGMVMRDEFRRTIYEPAPKMELLPNGEHFPAKDKNGKQIYEGTKPKYNPNYDPTQPYINRADRPEWSAVGMLGVLAVRDNGQCEINGYCTVGQGGIAVPAGINSINKYRVIKRNGTNVIEVVFR